MKPILVALFATAFTVTLHAQTSATTNSPYSLRDRQLEKARTLREGLRTARTPGDSLKILYNVFDASPRKEGIEVGREIYALAGRMGRTDAQLDIARLLTSNVSKEKDYDFIISELRKLPESEEREQTILFMQLKKISYASRRLSEKERQEAVAKIIAGADKNKPSTSLKRFENLITVVEYLRNDMSGDILNQSVEKLIQHVDTADIKLYALKNLAYADAALIYTDAGDAKSAIEADRRLLQVIDGLEKKYRAQGRIYRNYDINRFISYRRMMRNFDELTQQEIDNIDAKVRQLAERSPEVAADLNNKPAYKAYYNMATLRYAEAIPYLQKLIETTDAASVRRQALAHLAKAADETGNTALKAEALEQYNAMLEEYNRFQGAAKYRELQVLYDVQDLEARNARLELAERENEIVSARRTMTLLLVTFLIIAVVLVLMLLLWARFRKNAVAMGHIVDRFTDERDKLVDSVCYDYADTDPLAKAEAEAARKSSFEKNALKFQVSTKMTEEILNNLVFISTMGRNDRLKHIGDISVDAAMRRAVEQASEETGTHTRFNVRYPDDDTTVNTDVECLVFMLRHILLACADGSPEGAVEFQAEIAPECVKFIFASPEHDNHGGRDRNRFDEFLDYRWLMDHPRGGLFVCRLIAMMLKCKLAPDRDYKVGQSYVFTIPADLLCGTPKR